MENCFRQPGQLFPARSRRLLLKHQMDFLSEANSYTSENSLLTLAYSVSPSILHDQREAFQLSLGSRNAVTQIVASRKEEGWKRKGHLRRRHRHTQVSRRSPKVSHQEQTFMGMLTPTGSRE